MKLMLLSSSRTAGTGFLEHARQALSDFLADAPEGPVAFAPFAGIAIGYDRYTERLAEFLRPLGREVIGLHVAPEALDEASAVAVGGGNTFHLLWEMRRRKLLEPVARRAREGLPYIGWSAGSNLACPGIHTTNDMPIVEPGGFEALGLVPFQLNPHFYGGKPEGHQGESREERIGEFLQAHPDRVVLGLPEGDRLTVRDDEACLEGPHPAPLFRHDREVLIMDAGHRFSLAAISRS